MLYHYIRVTYLFFCFVSFRKRLKAGPRPHKALIQSAAGKTVYTQQRKHELILLNSQYTSRSHCSRNSFLIVKHGLLPCINKLPYNPYRPKAFWSNFFSPPSFSLIFVSHFLFKPPPRICKVSLSVCVCVFELGKVNSHFYIQWFPDRIQCCLTLNTSPHLFRLLL